MEEKHSFLFTKVLAIALLLFFVNVGTFVYNTFSPDDSITGHVVSDGETETEKEGRNPAGMRG